MHDATLAALESFPQRLESFFDAIPLAFRHWKPGSWEGIPSEPFSAIEQICHVRDIEVDGYQVRFHRALSETNPVLENVDGEALSIQRAYADSSSDKVFAEIRQARQQTLSLLAEVTPQQWRRRAVFDGVPITVRGLAHMLCSHDQQHLAGLQWLLARSDAERFPPAFAPT